MESVVDEDVPIVLDPAFLEALEQPKNRDFLIQADSDLRRFVEDPRYPIPEVRYCRR